MGSRASTESTTVMVEFWGPRFGQAPRPLLGSGPPRAAATSPSGQMEARLLGQLRKPRYLKELISQHLTARTLRLPEVGFLELTIRSWVLLLGRLLKFSHEEPVLLALHPLDFCGMEMLHI